MTYNEKQKIVATAVKLINLLQDCDDFDFVDSIVDSVASGETCWMEEEMSEELPY